jgi:hypothetical protein
MDEIIFPVSTGVKTRSSQTFVFPLSVEFMAPFRHDDLICYRAAKRTIPTIDADVVVVNFERWFGATHFYRFSCVTNLFSECFIDRWENSRRSVSSILILTHTFLVFFNSNLRA